MQALMLPAIEKLERCSALKRVIFHSFGPLNCTNSNDIPGINGESLSLAQNNVMK